MHLSRTVFRYATSNQAQTSPTASMHPIQSGESVCDQYRPQVTRQKNEKEDNINVRELKSILLAVQLYMPRHKNSTGLEHTTSDYTCKSLGL